MAPPKNGPSQFLSQGPSVPWAHRRPGYPLSGCVPAVFDPEAPFGLPSAMSSGRMELTAEGRPEGSPTLFLQARKGYQKKAAGSSALGHLSHASKIPEGSTDWSPGTSPGGRAWWKWLLLPMSRPGKKEDYAQSRPQLTQKFSGRAKIVNGLLGHGTTSISIKRSLNFLRLKFTAIFKILEGAGWPALSLTEMAPMKWGYPSTPPLSPIPPPRSALPLRKTATFLHI